MDDVTLPNWAWGILCGVMVLFLSLVAYLLANLISRYKEDIKTALDTAKEMKNVTCAFHQESFSRVHQQREQSETALENSIGELNKNIAKLETATSILNVHIENISEKHEDNKIAIGKLDLRLTTIESKLNAA